MTTMQNGFLRKDVNIFHSGTARDSQNQSIKAWWHHRNSYISPVYPQSGSASYWKYIMGACEQKMKVFFSTKCKKNLILQCWTSVGSNPVRTSSILLNPELNFRSGSAEVLNFELDFGPVLKSSGSNFGSGLNFGNTNHLPHFLSSATTKALAQ